MKIRREMVRNRISWSCRERSRQTGLDCLKDVTLENTKLIKFNLLKLKQLEEAKKVWLARASCLLWRKYLVSDNKTTLRFLHIDMYVEDLQNHHITSLVQVIGQQQQSSLGTWNRTGHRIWICQDESEAGCYPGLNEDIPDAEQQVPPESPLSTGF